MRAFRSRGYMTPPAPAVNISEVAQKGMWITWSCIENGAGHPSPCLKPLEDADGSWDIIKDRGRVEQAIEDEEVPWLAREGHEDHAEPSDKNSGALEEPPFMRIPGEKGV
jgi:hypothetical protein